MRRRAFIAGLGGVVAWPLVAHAQGGVLASLEICTRNVFS